MATDSHDPLDDSLKRAMKALDDQVSDRYFDELPNRTLSRLEEMMQSDVDRPTTPVAAQGSDGKSAAPPKPQRVEDSGLHDIRALASSTKERVSKKRATVNPPVDDSFIHTSSASLRAVALPEPSKMVQTGEHAVLVGNGTGPAASLLDGAHAVTAAPEAASAAPITPLARKKPSKAPVIVGTLAVAAAAGVAGFVILNQEKDAADSHSAAMMSAEKETAPTPTPDPARTAAAPAAAPAESAAGAAGAAQGQDSGVMKIAADSQDADGKAEERADEGDKKRNGRKDSDKGDGKAKDKDQTQKLDDKKKDGGETPGKGGKGGTPVSDATDVKKDDKKDDKKDGEGESLEDLLAQAGGGPADIVKKDDKPKTDKKALDATDIRKAMSALNAKAQACYAKFGVSGSVGVKLTVAPTGEIKKAAVTGAAAGTPTGDCVAEVVSHAKFPIWDGAPQTVTYSYFLSE
jgi:hypothetical protein